MELTAETSDSFLVTPDLWVMAWSLVCVVGGVVTAAKGRWGFLVVGVVLGGLTWPLSALLIAAPDSLWARTFYGGRKMSRARREFSRRLPYAQP